MTFIKKKPKIFNMKNVRISDNVWIQARRDGAEFLEISCRPVEAEYRSYEVSLSRYCVPGRCDIYSFRVGYGGKTPKLEYSSSEWTPLPLAKAIKLVEEDLNKPQVVAMFVEAFSVEKQCLRYDWSMIALLSIIGPETKTYRAVIHAANKVRTAHVAGLVKKGLVTQEDVDRCLYLHGK